MGGAQSTAYSSSSSYVNGVGTTNTDSSSCAWLNPFCSGASANTATYAANASNPVFLVSSLAILTILCTFMLILQIRFKGLFKKNQACRTLEFLGNKRLFKYNLDDDFELISIEASKPFFEDSKAKNETA